MSITPEKSTRYIVVRAKKPIRFQGSLMEFNVKCLFIDPCQWDTTDYRKIEQICLDRFLSWIHQAGTCFKDAKRKNNLDLIGAVRVSLLDLPRKWRIAFLKDPTCIEGQYCYTMFQVVLAAFLWDDVLDVYTGKPNFEDLVKAVTIVIDKIMVQEFESQESLNSFLKDANCVLLDPKFTLVLALQQKIATDLRDIYGIRTKDYPHYLSSYHASYDHLTWLDDNGMAAKSGDFRRWKYFRFFTVGASVWVETFFVLSKLSVPFKVRHDKYWQRAFYLTVMLNAVVNDFASFEKESEEEFNDNAIYVNVRQGMSLPEAIQTNVEYYDDIVTELNQILDYIQSGKYQIPADADPCVASDQEQLYRESLELMISSAAGLWQCHFACGRYNITCHFE